jgi:hypothetical protein
VVSLQLKPDRAALEAWRRDAPIPGARGALGGAAVELHQLLGPVVVNELVERWTIVPCLDLQPCDQIVQMGNAGGDRSVILLDARRQAGDSGYSNDEIHRSAQTAPVGNALESQDCRSEVAVFSEADAMALLEKVQIWTDACGDTLTVQLDPILEVPVSFFLVEALDPITPKSWFWGGSSVTDLAKEDLDNANQVYDENKTGISFVMDETRIVRDLIDLVLPIADALMGAWESVLDPVSFVCDVTTALENHGYYDAGRLNVYYLPLPGTGMICPDDRNVIFIASERRPATLAHELAHSLSLLGDWGHTTEIGTFASDNVMWTGDSDVRDRFSLGQAFRQNVDCTSTINVNQVRQGPVRSCPLKVESDSCPALDLDWARP